jgi:pyruvate dehydrogenase E1 component beta subunit
MATITYAQAFIDGIYQAMAEEPRLTVIGRSILGHGGARGLERKLMADFASRIIDPPTAEGGVAALAIGAAMAGERVFAHFGTASFALEAFNQLVNEAAVARYMSNGQVSVPVTFHMYHGIRGGGAAQHSASPQAMFAGVAGLEVVLPSTAADAKGLIRTALKNDNPTVFINHTRIMGLEGEVPDGDTAIPFGRADVKREGTDVTAVAMSRMVHRTLEAAEIVANEGIETEVVDPRTAAPLDTDGICASVAKTGRLVTVEEAIGPCSIASEVAAAVAEGAFGALKAPVVRIARAPVPVPFSPPLEDAITPSAADIAAAIRKVMG